MHFESLTHLILLATVCLFGGSVVLAQAQEPSTEKQEIRVGIIGLDTSHSIAFAKLLNAEDGLAPLKNFRVVCAFPQGSLDIEASASRIPGYTQQIKELGIEVVDSIDELISKVDAVLLETNDGRPHLKQAIPVLRANKPMFIDKPVAADLTDVLAIFQAAEHFGTPIFSASSLRFAKPALAARAGELVGPVLGCETYSPATLEPTHTDLYWYGIHGVEQLVTVMGPGCQSVARTHTDTTDVVVGVWDDGRIGTFRGTRSGPHHYGGTVFGEKGQSSTGGSEGYEALVLEVAKFFQSGIIPVDSHETIEIYAFMSAADISKQKNGARVMLSDVMEQAKKQVAERLGQYGINANSQ